MNIHHPLEKRKQKHIRATNKEDANMIIFNKEGKIIYNIPISMLGIGEIQISFADDTFVLCL